MKKILNPLLSLFLVLFLFSCDKNENTDLENDNSDSDNDQNEVIQEKVINFKDLSGNIPSPNGVEDIYSIPTNQDTYFQSGIANFWRISYSGKYMLYGFYYSSKNTFIENPGSISAFGDWNFYLTAAPKAGVNSDTYVVFSFWKFYNKDIKTKRKITFSNSVNLKKISIANSALLYNGMKYGIIYNGDNYPKISGNDYFKIIIHAYDENDKLIGSKEGFLAKDGNVSSVWENIDFDFTEKVKYLDFNYDISWSGNFDIPFCIGDIVYLD